MLVSSFCEGLETNLGNCFLCGHDFTRMHQERICGACRARRRVLKRELSPRQQQIAALIAGAKANKEIAWDLHLTDRTVQQYVSDIFRKLGLNNRTELAVWWLTSEGLIEKTGLTKSGERR